MKYKILIVISLFLISMSFSISKTESPLEKSERLITELKYYDALIALESLLTDDKKSND